MLRSDDGEVLLLQMRAAVVALGSETEGLIEKKKKTMKKKKGEDRGRAIGKGIKEDLFRD